MNSDHEIVQRSKSGDETAFEELVHTWEPRLTQLAYRMTGSVDRAEDVRQIALIRIYQGLPEFDGSSSFSTWAYRIVMNICHDEMRRNRSVQRRERGAASRDHQTASHTEHDDSHESVARAVSGLPEDERAVVILRHYSELKFAEIAEVLSAPVTTIKSRALRGLQRLRDELNPMSIPSKGKPS